MPGMSFMGSEFGFKGTGNIRAAIENRDIAVLGRSAFPSQAFNLADDVLGFAFGIGQTLNLDRVPCSIEGIEILRDTFFVLGDQQVGRIENGLRRAIVPIQDDGFGIGELLGEIEDDVLIGPAPGVNRLVWIANHIDIGLGGDEQLHQLILNIVGILELIDQDMVKTVGPFLSDVRVLAQNPNRLEQQVIEVEAEHGIPRQARRHLDARRHHHQSRHHSLAVPRPRPQEESPSPLPSKPLAFLGGFNWPHHLDYC